MTQKQKKTASAPLKPAGAAKRKAAPAVAKMKAAPPRSRPRSTAKSISENEVRLKAYSLWESRGCPIGSPEVDWFQAKEQLSPAR